MRFKTNGIYSFCLVFLKILFVIFFYSNVQMSHFACVPSFVRIIKRSKSISEKKLQYPWVSSRSSTWDISHYRIMITENWGCDRAWRVIIHITNGMHHHSKTSGKISFNNVPIPSSLLSPLSAFSSCRVGFNCLGRRFHQNSNRLNQVERFGPGCCMRHATQHFYQTLLLYPP